MQGREELGNAVDGRGMMNGIREFSNIIKMQRINTNIEFCARRQTESKEQWKDRRVK